MSRLAMFRQAELELQEQLAKLDSMKKDESLQREIEFEEKLRALMAEYNVALPGIRAILDPHSAQRSSDTSAPERRTRAPRALKVYKNPHDGQVIETKGGNHKLLKEWKSQHGSDVVESWLQS